MNTSKIDTVVRNLTTAYIQALQTGAETRATYLRTLVEESQRELGLEPRANNRKAKHIGAEEQARQLAAVAAVHGRFYAIINEVVDASLTDVPSKDHTLERNRRTNFARTALYAVRLYIRAGKDLTAVAPARVTKSTLAVEARPTIRSPGRLKSRVERASKAFVTSLLELGEADKQAALAELDTLLGIMANQMAALGAPPARDLKHAVEQHKPFRSGATLFVPTQTTVLRQIERPS